MAPLPGDEPVIGAATSQPKRTFAPMLVTPQDMLAAFHMQGDPQIKQQLEMFKKMQPSAQRELLFFMAAHTNVVLRQILNHVQPPT